MADAPTAYLTAGLDPSADRRVRAGPARHRSSPTPRLRTRGGHRPQLRGPPYLDSTPAVLRYRKHGPCSVGCPCDGRSDGDGITAGRVPVVSPGITRCGARPVSAGAGTGTRAHHVRSSRWCRCGPGTQPPASKPRWWARELPALPGLSAIHRIPLMILSMAPEIASKIGRRKLHAADTAERIAFQILFHWSPSHEMAWWIGWMPLVLIRPQMYLRTVHASTTLSLISFQAMPQPTCRSLIQPLTVSMPLVM